MNHNWVMQGTQASPYDTTYKCFYCKKTHTVSADSSSWLEEDGCPPTTERIKAEIKIHEGAVARAKGDIAALRALCTHPRLKKKHGADTGNWCRQDDCYWTDFDCPDCGKRWTEEGSK